MTHDKAFAEALADLIVEYGDVPVVELIEALEEALILLRGVQRHTAAPATTAVEAAAEATAKALASNEHHEPLHGVWRD